MHNYYRLLVFIFLIQWLPAHSQDSREIAIIDSVFTTLDTIESPHHKIIVLHQQANYIYDFAPFTKLFLDSAMALAQVEDSQEEIAISHLTLMQYYPLNANQDSSEWHYQRALLMPVVKANPVHQSDFYMMKATILKNQGNVKGAVDYFLKALALLEQRGLEESITDADDQIGIDRSRCILHNNLANLYKDIHDFEAAVQHYDRSYDILMDLDEKLLPVPY